MDGRKEEKRHYLGTDVFHIWAAERIKTAAISQFALITLDFDNFNYVNDLFSYEVGDRLLDRITEHFIGQMRDGEVLTRLHADHFAFWLYAESAQAVVQRLHEMTNMRALLDGVLPKDYSLVCSGGVVLVSDGRQSLAALLDKANFARKQAKGSCANTFLVFDEKMNEEVGWRKAITLAMESALKRREFEMFLQPKVLLKTEEIVGAEALVRWNSPEHGMIVPDRFIPILEQNGFIRQLDFFMLAEACRFLSRSEALGIPKLPISVNFSKVHVRTPGLVDKIYHIAKEYAVAPQLIEIEFTENVFLDDYHALLDIARSLKFLGFRVSLDDFGKAYSSLSHLKELPLDVIKIDKEFLRATTNSEKGRVIIAKMVELIKSLRMTSVMEGVETEEQVDFLQKLCCDLGQGYFYARPMPVPQYIEFVREGKPAQDDALLFVESGGEPSYQHTVPQEFQMDNWELFTLSQNIDMGLMKGYICDACTMQYVNDRALGIIGYTRQEFREALGNSVLAFTHPDDIPSVLQNFQVLKESGKPISFSTRAIRKDGACIVLQGRGSCVMDRDGRPIAIFAFQDVTDSVRHTEMLQRSLESKIAEQESIIASERESREALRVSEERYRLIVEQSDDVMFDWDFAADEISFSDKFARVFGRPSTSHWATDPAYAARYVHPDDRQAFEQWVQETYRQPNSTGIELRVSRTDGAYLWLRGRSTPMLNREGSPVRAVGVFTDITRQKDEVEALTRKSQLDPLTHLFNKEEMPRRVQSILLGEPDSPGALFIIDVDNFKGVNDNLGHQFGDSVLVEVAQKTQALFRETDVVGRIGGDELAVFARGLPDGAALRERADMLVQTMRSTYFGATAQYAVSISVGIACYPAHGSSFGELYHLADVALYESKGGGKDRYTVYQQHMTRSLISSRTPVEYTERFLNNYFKNDFTYNVFEMLYETKDMSTSIQKVLELTGRRFAADRVYIFQYSEDRLRTRNTFEWCAPGVQPEIDTLQDLQISDLQSYIDRYSPEGMLSCTDLSEMDQYTYETLKRQGIQSFLHCAIYDKGEMSGFLGFDWCREKHQWRGDELATLGYLSRILSVFLQRSDARQELVRSHANYMEMLGSLSGYVYVIDAQTYELLYLNKAAESVGMTMGHTCHYAAFRSDAPCEGCPIKQLSDDVKSASTDVYSKLLKRWVNTTASRLHWVGRGTAVLLCCTDISRYLEDAPAQV